MHWAAGEQSCCRLSAHSSQSVGGEETGHERVRKRPEAAQAERDGGNFLLTRVFAANDKGWSRASVKPSASSTWGWRWGSLHRVLPAAPLWAKETNQKPALAHLHRWLADLGAEVRERWDSCGGISTHRCEYIPLLFILCS